MTAISNRFRAGASRAGLLGLALTMVASVSLAAGPDEPLEALELLVNPFIGTGGWVNLSGTNSGMTFPGATWPLGLVRLSPDTRHSDRIKHLLSSHQIATAGYNYHHNRVMGFSHTRQSGTGGYVGGLFRVRPTTDEGQFRSRKGWLGLEHPRESAHAGFYAIEFPGDGIRAELTSSVHCGFHRYTRLAADKTLRLLIEGDSTLSGRDTGPDNEVRVDPLARVIEGSTRLNGDMSHVEGGLKVYFHARYTEGVEKTPLWAGRKWLGDGELVARGEHLGAGLVAAAGTESVGLTLCLSFVSRENARLNYAQEAAGRTFEQARAEAEQAWRATLGRIRARSPDRDVLVSFYTGLYHAFLLPTHFTDVNGEYAGFDGKAHRAEGFTYRTDFSLWDTFRTVHPLYTLIAPEIQRDSLRSLLEMARIHGVLPLMPMTAGDAGAMIGSPANFLFSESYLKGIRDFDAPEALRLMAQVGREGVPEGKPGREKVCAELGYCPADRVAGSVSKTLEYAWADFATARLAEALGDPATAIEFDARAQAYRQVWNPKTRYFAPRDSKGEFRRFKPELPMWLHFTDRNSRAFTEGSGFQWRFGVPHDPAGLAELMGGRERLAQELERFVSRARARADFDAGAAYWHGDEHDLHAIYLFDEAGRPDLAQKYARWALRSRYANLPNGLDGNDDAGTLSAWYVLSAVGLYPQAGTDRYWIGSPNLEEATLDLGEGHQLRIRARGQSARNVYLQGVTLNGKPYCKPWITHAELRDATLEFDLSPLPGPGGGFGGPGCGGR